MNSPELLLLVENCPKGAETLVTRCLHSLTDKVPPSPELVKRVRDLYHKRLPDVRFLIPVLNGLEKKEVIQALPKLIKLNPIVVKEVFNRLLGTQHGEGNSALSPLNPGELLIALHNIDSVKCDMKSIIKGEALPPSPPKWPGCCGPREEPQSPTCARWNLPSWRLCHLQPHLSSGYPPSSLFLPPLLLPPSLPPSIQGTGLSTMRWHRVALKKGGEPLPPQAWPEE